MAGLSNKQQRFVEEYMKDTNAAQAAIRAGYAASTADKKAPLWVGKSREKSSQPKVWDAVQAGLTELSEEAKMDAAWILEEQRRIYDRTLIDEDFKQSANARQILTDMGKHRAVDAFVRNDNNQATQPGGDTINWNITFVSVTKEDYEKGKGKPCIEHQS